MSLLRKKVPNIRKFHKGLKKTNGRLRQLIKKLDTKIGTAQKLKYFLNDLQNHIRKIAIQNRFGSEFPRIYRRLL